MVSSSTSEKGKKEFWGDAKDTENQTIPRELKCGEDGETGEHLSIGKVMARDKPEEDEW